MSRLVEYVIAVGIKRPNVDATQSPELMRKFPPTDHKDFPLPPDVVFFCQPEGCTTAAKRISLRQTNSFVFTLTDKETGITRYGICCNFFRPCLGIPQKRHSKVGLSISSDPEENPPLEVMERKLVMKPRLCRTKSMPANRDETPRRHGHHNALNSMLCYSLTSICIISSYPFFSTFRECLYVLRKLIESQCWSKERESDSREDGNSVFFDDNKNIGHMHNILECRNWSTFFNNHDLNSQHIKSNLLEIDDWIRNLLKIPLPVAALNRVEVELLPRHIQPPLTFALPEKSRFSFLDFPAHLPLELLGVETCLKVLTCIMLEQKVVLQSCDYNALSISVMALTSMLYPLEYMFPVIPLLPTCMKNAEQLLLAPTPYVIGIPSSFFRIKGMNFQVPHDVLIVDLDTNKMNVPLSMDEIPPLPEPEGSALKEQLKQCLACLSFSPQPVCDLDKATELPRPRLSSFDGGNRSHMIYGNDIDSVDIAVRSALVKFFCSPNILEGFVQHTRILRLYPRPVVAFVKDSFLESRPEKSKFIQALVDTQAVEYFAEWMVNPENTVFSKVKNGILDPRIIGDKPRWYSHYVQPFYFQVHDPHSQLGFGLYEDSDSDSDDREYPSTIQEERECTGGHYDDGDMCSCCSSGDDSDSEVLEVHSSSNEDINDKIHSMYDSSYSTLHTAEETLGLQEVVLMNSVYSMPAYRSEEDVSEDKGSHATLNSITEDEQVSPPIHDDQKSEISVDSNHTEASPNVEKPTAVRKFSAMFGNIKPKLTSKLSTASTTSIVSATSIISSPPERLVAPKPIAVHTLKNGLDRSSSDSFQQIQSGRNILQDQNIYNSENQQLITEVVGYVKSGDGIGWLSTKKMRRVVAYEGLRQYLINQIDLEQKSNMNTLNDVHVSRNIYRGYLELVKLVVEGYESSMKFKGLGGLGSVFPFLEVSHRYYCGKKYLDESNDTSMSSSSSRKSSLVDSIKESSSHLESSTDRESDSSLHYHRDLPGIHQLNISKDSRRRKVSSAVSDLSDDYHSSTETPSLNHSGLHLNLGSRTASLESDSSCPLFVAGESKEKYLQTKSNCSGGWRFYDGVLVKSHLEKAGRGVTGTGRRYLFEGLQRNRSAIWDNLEFWECAFLDSVTSERDAAGMDVNPIELVARYKGLTPQEKKLLEEDEDNLLGILLHNMISFMLCMDVPKPKIKFKVRRLLARAHIGLNQTQWIDKVLDSLEHMNGNDIDLLVPRSRQLKIQIFVVHLGDTQSGPVFFLEVREDCMVLKSTSGSIIERWWYENVVNLSCSPKTRVLCVWIRTGEETDLQKICTKKCKLLYNSIKESMKKAAERLDKEGTGINLGGDFTVVDSLSGQQGILKVSLEGVSIVFVEKKIAIDVHNLKNCCAKQKVLIVEEYIPHNQSVIEHQFYTDEANEICYAILCLFSYIAAAKNILTPNSGRTSNSDQNTIA